MLGRIEGEALGAVLGLEDGSTDGMLLGRIEGKKLGAVLGIEDG